MLTSCSKRIIKIEYIIETRDALEGAVNMDIEQDYIMRMIKEFANVLGRLLFNKKTPMYELD